VFPHASLNVVKLLVHVTFPQLSVAVAPPLLFSQVFKSAVFPSPSHSTVKSSDGEVMVGGVSSCMVNVAVLEVIFPHSSVAMNSTDTVPVLAQRSLSTGFAGLVVHVISLQDSVTSI